MRSKGVQCRSQIAQYLHTDPDSKGEGSKGFPELQTVVTCGWFDKLREASSMLAPIEFPRVNNHASNGGAMASNPLGCAVDDNVGAMVDRAAEKSTSSKGIVNLSKVRFTVLLK